MQFKDTIKRIEDDAWDRRWAALMGGSLWLLINMLIPRDTLTDAQRECAISFAMLGWLPLCCFCWLTIRLIVWCLPANHPTIKFCPRCNANLPVSKKVGNHCFCSKCRQAGMLPVRPRSDDIFLPVRPDPDEQQHYIVRRPQRNQSIETIIEEEADRLGDLVAGNRTPIYMQIRPGDLMRQS